MVCTCNYDTVRPCFNCRLVIVPADVLVHQPVSHYCGVMGTQLSLIGSSRLSANYPSRSGRWHASKCSNVAQAGNRPRQLKNKCPCLCPRLLLCLMGLHMPRFTNPFPLLFTEPRVRHFPLCLASISSISFLLPLSCLFTFSHGNES